MITKISADSLQSLPRDEIIERCLALSNELEHVSEIERVHQQKLEVLYAQKARQKRLLSNKSMNGNLKVLLLRLEEKRSSSSDFTPIDIFELERETGLSHSSMSRLLKALQVTYKAIIRQDTFQERVKEKQRIVVDKIGFQFTEQYLQSPEDLAATDDGQVRVKRKKDPCPDCGSRDTERIYHLLCRNCGGDHPHYPEDFDQTERTGDLSDQGSSELTVAGQGLENELIQVERVEIQDDLGEETHDPVDQVELDQVERVSVGAFMLTSEQVDFLNRWCAVSHNPYAISARWEYDCIVKLAPVITTTEKMQSIWDLSETRIREYAKAMGRQATPSRLYNLDKCLPDWLASQRKEESPPQERHVSGIGRLPNWSEKMKDMPAPDYSYVMEMNRQRDERHKPGGTWMSEEMAKRLEKYRKRMNPNEE